MHPSRPRLRLAGWRELAGFSLWTWAGSLAGLVWDRCDPFVLGPRFGAGRLGLYLQALELAALPATELILPAVEALFAGFSSAQRAGGNPVRLAPVVALALVMSTLPLTITLSCGSGYVVAALPLRSRCWCCTTSASPGSRPRAWQAFRRWPTACWSVPCRWRPMRRRC